MNDEHLPAVIEPAPLVLIQQALNNGIKPADIKELFDLQVRYEQRRAEEAYADAITAFQAECPAIHKSKNVEGKYNYAPLDKIMQAVLPVLRKYKIVVTFDTAEDAGTMHVTCRTRVGVVEKVTTVALPVPPANKLTNATQASVGAITYGKRTALVAALNIICTDEDVDGFVEQPAPQQPQVSKEVAAFQRFVAEGPTAAQLTECYFRELMALPKGSLERQQGWNTLNGYAKSQGWAFDAKARAFVEPQEAGA